MHLKALHGGGKPLKITLDLRPARTMALVRIEHFARIVEQMGVIGSNAVSVQFAKLLRQSLLKGTVDMVGKRFFDHAGCSTPLTSSIGVRMVG